MKKCLLGMFVLFGLLSVSNNVLADSWRCELRGHFKGGDGGFFVAGGYLSGKGTMRCTPVVEGHLVEEEAVERDVKITKISVGLGLGKSAVKTTEGEHDSSLIVTKSFDLIGDINDIMGGDGFFKLAAGLGSIKSVEFSRGRDKRIERGTTLDVGIQFGDSGDAFLDIERGHLDVEDLSYMVYVLRGSVTLISYTGAMRT